MLASLAQRVGVNLGVCVCAVGDAGGELPVGGAGVREVDGVVSARLWRGPRR